MCDFVHRDAILGGMRTTVTIDDDVAAAVERLRREKGLGLSEALNQLARSGMSVRRPTKRFRQRTQRIGLRIDVTDVVEALETLDGPATR
jgi:hypothetical protein